MRSLCFISAVAIFTLLFVGCTHTSRLRYFEVDSEAVGKTIRYAVWAPQDLRPNESLPMLVFLHGSFDDEGCFDEAEVGQSLDRALSAGEIPRAVVVVPDGRAGFWENWHDGSVRYRDWVIQEVIPSVQTEFNTRPCPEGCHIAGASTGGLGALRFALFAPEIFSTVSSLSGLTLDADGLRHFTDSWVGRYVIPSKRIWGPLNEEMLARNDLFARWQSQADLRGLRLMVAWAEEDKPPITETNELFRQHLLERRIEHDHFIFPGQHSWAAWRPVIDQILRFAVWGSIDAEPPPAAG